jgi:hypothetical protein
MAMPPPLKKKKTIASSIQVELGCYADMTGKLEKVLVDCDNSATLKQYKHEFRNDAQKFLHTSVLAIGGNHITNDVAVGLRTPATDAERIKQKYGCALSSLVQKDDTIEVASVGNRPPRVLARQLPPENVPRLFLQV